MKKTTREYFDSLAGTHDSTLPEWGPYSKIMAGVAHVFDKERGASFNFSAFPCIYRGEMRLPLEAGQGNFYPFYASGDLSVYMYRFELIWKDQLYCDVIYKRISHNAVLCTADFHNNTGRNQMVGMHLLSSMQFPKKNGEFVKWVKPVCRGKYTFTDGVSYKSLEIGEKSCKDRLCYDGRFLCEEIGSGFTNGRALGERFGKCRGDKVVYELNTDELSDYCIYIRAKGQGSLSASGASDGIIELSGDTFHTYRLKPQNSNSKNELVLTCGDGCKGVIIDSIVCAESDVLFEEEELCYVPELENKGTGLSIKYSNDCAYGIIREESDCMLREICGSQWQNLMNEHDIDHVTVKISGDGREHFTDLYLRPFFIKPHESKTLTTVIVNSKADELEKVFAAYEGLNRKKLAEEAIGSIPRLPEDPYAFSQRLMRATLLTNIVFPVYCQGEYIRHFTPGKWWDSLYTWDSGFIALGLSSFDEDRALETLNCYLTDVGNPHAAFIHHGSPVPVQAYVYKQLWDITADMEYLRSFYPRMRQYYEFLLGRAEGSDTRRLKSGLINTFSYFYNSGGWDDYPPQVYVHKNELENNAAPCVGTVHAIVFARILEHASKLLGLSDAAVYEKDINELSSALQKYAYDDETGFFSYVYHDENGVPVGILRDDNGVNYNLGLDGAEPLLTGALSEEQEKRLIRALFDENRFFTPYGISTVDRTAPYFRQDGYWNGAIWMPHQWFIFLAMLSANEPDKAIKIAQTALELWKAETDESYNCLEHFIVETGRGGGWLHFGGLSAPVVLWYDTMYKKGTITAPIEAFILSKEFNNNYTSAQIEVDTDSSRERVTLLINMQTNKNMNVLVNGVKSDCIVSGQVIALSVNGGMRSVISISQA